MIYITYSQYIKSYFLKLFKSKSQIKRNTIKFYSRNSYKIYKKFNSIKLILDYNSRYIINVNKFKNILRL